MPRVIGKDTGATPLVADFETQGGQAGELHQIAPEGGMAPTTHQGVADDQNTLRFSARGPALVEDFCLSSHTT